MRRSGPPSWAWTPPSSRGELGGACTNRGCIPTKAMLHGADLAHAVRQADSLGIKAELTGIDLDALVGHADSVIGQLRAGIGGLLKANGVEIITGTAAIPAKGAVEVNGEDGTRTLRGDHIILATGARPKSIPGVTPDDDRIWTSTEALHPSSLPDSLLVIGSGAIDVEFASLYCDLGVEVTVLEVLPRILPTEDPEVCAFMEHHFGARGIRVHTDVSDVATAHGVTTFTTKEGTEESVTTDVVLVATGVAPNTEGLGLDGLCVERDRRGFIVADEWSRTTVAGLYVVGDVTGGPCLAHKASHEAVVCVEHLAGVSSAHPLRRDRVPGCIYTRPQVASGGVSEEEAKKSGANIVVGRFSLSGNGKALAPGEADGFVKTIFDIDTGELLGAHMVGPDGTEMIQGFTVAQAFEATPETLVEAIVAHPTVSEAMHESVLAALGRSIWPPGH
ncbi:dihydrolipoyl dehydrogenase [Cutibacterium sp. V947]|uniref:dihydrolipoyl dehydrogenase n=1 Tax=Cutibacterium sp. V947 TaxID=3446480 RepID=UPI003EE29509